MPTYGYQCTECKHEFSVFQNMKDDPIAICTQCSGRVKRLLYPVGIVFKGTGWYINDSRAPEKTEKSDSAEKSEKTEKSEPAAASSESSGETKTAAPAAESKPDAAPVPALTPAPTK